MQFSGAGRDGDEIWQAEASTEATSLLIKKGKFFISSNNQPAEDVKQLDLEKASLLIK